MREDAACSRNGKKPDRGHVDTTGESGRKESRESNGVKSGETSGAPSHEEYRKRIAGLQALASEYKEMLQRLQAEFENATKRAERDKGEFLKFAASRTVEGFLPVVDSIEGGIRQAEKSGNREMKNGLEIIRKQFMKAMEANGVRQIESVGRKFNHSLHEVVMAGKDDSKEEGDVLEEFQIGYTLNGGVLRPAKVKINKKE